MMLNRLTVILASATVLTFLGGCEMINSINPFASEEETWVEEEIPPTEVAPAVPTSPTPFRDAVNKAMEAANAVQTAQTQAEWQQVAQTWQEAIALMQQVPADDPNYATAQEKVTEYQGYLEYAQTNASNTGQ
ncbi:hypothetical protein K4A83_22425 [Spirulina subsalsa FACHB-351]|uniref:Uncharacterized protein n=1 Tax=Spirulina subsalsa FACHB-351 TaxID=234711 RepID=A0ABT3LBT7_9CYAN|nr:hypothetical protein [Spirulina subsalsa]MCW6038986.1 hypothetical protein [Spirulina subsalsa FACHB-351]